MTSYQKLKFENALLKKQLKELVLNPMSQMSSEIRMAINVMNDAELMMMFGDSGIKKVKFNGILSKVIQQ